MISRKLKSFRKFSGLSQEAFAQKLGVSFTTVNRWENGHAAPNQLAKKNIENIWREMGFESQENQLEDHFKILLVDDDPKIILMLKRTILMSEFDISIDTAEDGYEAGLKISTFKPDLVILDIFLPGVGGDMVCKRIKQNKLTANTFLIVISGNLDGQLKNKLIDFGADIVFEKPLDSKTIKEIISKQRELKLHNQKPTAGG